MSERKKGESQLVTFTGLLCRTIRDMQLPKLIAEDVPLFNALNSDFFPGLEIPPTDYGEFQKAIEASIEKRSLQVTCRAKRRMKSRESGY